MQTKESTSVRVPVPAAFFCWYETSVHSKPISRGSTSFATCSSARITSSELYPGAGEPMTCTARYRL